MIPDKLFELLLQEFSSDPVHDYILKTFSSSPLKPGETEFYYSPLGLNTFTVFDEQRERIAAQRLHHVIPSFTEEFMANPWRFAGSTSLADQMMTSYANSLRPASEQTVVQTIEVVAALLDVIGTQQSWQALQLYHGQSHDRNDYFLLQTGIVPLLALARDLAHDHEILDYDAELAHFNNVADFVGALSNIAMALVHRWFSEVVINFSMTSRIQAAWPYLLVPTQNSWHNEPLAQDSFKSQPLANVNSRHVQLLLPFSI
ncbi:hypothetical protein [uncultured Limosilactobacillus sp.]|uniref:hypothetical protein n=1 Tax=uncultured Limosilactobacillus sp. TaxID=2837629 RepID=UPI0025F2DF5F|nr:hypothetical protein [uncultured Limosilactobacillus sp.]